MPNHLALIEQVQPDPFFFLATSPPWTTSLQGAKIAHLEKLGTAGIDAELL